MNPDNFFSLFNISPFVIIRFEETKSGSRGGIWIEAENIKKEEGKTETVLEKKQGSCWGWGLGWRVYPILSFLFSFLFTC